MKTYIVAVESKKNKAVKISQVGYTTLEAAKRFIRSRSDSPKALTAYAYDGIEFMYFIHEIIIIE